MEKNKKYYKQNKKNYYKKNKNEVKKVTYDGLMKAKTITETNNDDSSYNKILIMKYIAVSIVIFAIIIGSFLIFRAM